MEKLLQGGGELEEAKTIIAVNLAHPSKGTYAETSRDTRRDREREGVQKKEEKSMSGRFRGLSGQLWPRNGGGVDRCNQKEELRKGRRWGGKGVSRIVST